MPAPSTADRITEVAEQHRPELLVHCYRMLGSPTDAQDAVQETMVRAWRARDRYDADRASVRTWLYRIATNVCLTALRGRARRPLPSGVGPAFDDPEAPFAPGLDVPWLQPFPDRLLPGPGADPEQAAVASAGVRLALVAAIQLLPPRQRAVLVLREVLRFSAAEVAAMLDTSVAAVNSAGQRGRARLQGLDLATASHRAPDPAEQDLVDRYAEALERADVEGLVRLVTADALLEMPPMRNWYVGRAAYAGFMRRVFATRGTEWRTVPTRANGQPALAAYRPVDGRHQLHTVQVFSADRGLLDRTTVFQAPEVFALLGLAPTLP